MNQFISWAITLTLALACIFLTAWILEAWKLKPVTCSDFSHQIEAQQALVANPQLDSDHDGTACENML